MKKVVVITGASAGIGLETARLFASKDCIVYCLQRRESKEFNSIKTDVTNKEAVKCAIAQIVSETGRIDTLVCNAGMGISGAIEDTTEEQARKIMDVNFFGALFVIQEVMPIMRAQKHGTIINISSAGAPLSLPFQAFYSASKSALSSMSEALRTELKPYGIKVTSLLPGDVKTDFTGSREKFDDPQSIYNDRVAKSVATMERDEQNGMPASFIAREIYRLSVSPNPPVSRVAGAKYKVFVMMGKMLPKRLMNYLIGAIYG